MRIPRPTPWDQLVDQWCIKYGSVQAARSIASPFVSSVIDLLLLDPQEHQEAKAPLIDIRYWPWLRPGDIPGVPGWHYDVWNDPVKGKDDHHRLWFDGAGCQTEFSDGSDGYPRTWKAEMGHCVYYSGSKLHRITECTEAGPRILVRASWTSVRAITKTTRYGHVSRQKEQ